MCPSNKVGHIDLLVVSHHGWYQSSSPALVDAIAPEIAVMDNGATKGGTPATIDTIRKSPGLKALYQLHYSEEGGAAHNADEQYIANIVAPAKKTNDPGNFIAVDAQRDGSMKVFNSRTGTTTDYPATKR